MSFRTMSATLEPLAERNGFRPGTATTTSLIIGAGFSGLGVAIALRRAGRE